MILNLLNLTSGMNRTCAVFGLCALSAMVAVRAHAELPAEPVPNVAVLSPDYPDSLIFAHDANFEALVAGRIVLVDVAADNRHYKGALDAAQFAGFTESGLRGELYVAETHYSRTTRGERTDVLSIYDRKTLSLTGELILPGGKRGQVVSNRYTTQLIDEDRFLLVFNFTPAASVWLIDLDQRRIVAEIETPGCGLAYPTGRRGFSALCSNGSMYSVQVDEQGQILEEAKMSPFFNVDQDPLFDKPVFIGDTAWFPSFTGHVQAVDLSGSIAEPGERWSLTSARERKQGWRPGGWQIATASDDGRLFVLFHKGEPGSHKGGGPEVWVYDPKRKQRVNRFVLETWGVSIEVTRGDQPLLVVTNADMNLDVYDAGTGQWLRMIGDVAAMPLNLHAVR